MHTAAALKPGCGLLALGPRRAAPAPRRALAVSAKGGKAPSDAPAPTPAAPPTDIPAYFQPAPVAPQQQGQAYQAVPAPQYAPPPAPEGSFWSRIPPLVYIGVGVVLAGVLGKVLEVVKGGPQRMQQMAMEQMMKQMMKQMGAPPAQKMLYPYLPEPMRNPETFEWMLSNPEYRTQLEGMLQQQVASSGSPAMAEMMQGMDMSPEKMQAQFDALGMTPDQFIGKVMADPDLAGMMTNPKIMAAIAECTKNPMAIFNYQNDPEVLRVFEKMSQLFPQAAGAGALPTMPPGMATVLLMHDRGCGPQQHRGPKNLADLVGAVGRAPTVPEMEQDDETALGAAPPRRESFAKSRASPLGAAAGVLLTMVGATVAALGLPALDSSTAAAATAAWLAILSVASGTNPGAMLLLCFQLPPVAMAASACCTAAALASMNARVCASDFLQHPESAWRLEAYYRWLEPLIAPIEPLLLATGLHREHSERHCHCVLAAHQFWLVAVMPTLLVAVLQVRSYRRWRTEQRQLTRQWRRQQAQAWNFPLSEPSSSCSSDASSGDDGSSSDGSSDGGGGRGRGGMVVPVPLSLVPLSSQLPPAYRRKLAVSRRLPPRWSAQTHRPDDWQWALAERMLRRLRPTYAVAAVVLLAVAVGGAWHQQAFP
ncbi:hypothetical protein COHA_009645 [Chlorella ohadii]|uniref:STI1 domain-containing protein n=1 Tax=Chlorella ohadii TaxID=2649997 RepID=A0AAD5H220_9CHLO|nr:hypothetical protein COHA_009645 [Chlorella ohadii]